MFRNTRHRLFTVLFVLTSLLFSQLALAAYVCPGNDAQAAQVSMPCAELMSKAMDEELPNLCQAHCKAGEQKAESYEIPMLASLPDQGADYLASQVLLAPPAAHLQAPLLSRTTAPPLAIRNCCFRI